MAKKTRPLPRVKDKALSDTRVLDEDYSYTSPKWPGKINGDPNLTRAEMEHQVHSPLVREL